MIEITGDQVVELLDIDRLIDRLADGFVEVSAGKTSVPPRVAAFAPEGYLGAMPGYAAGVLEAKLVTVFPNNHDKGLPSHQAMIFLFEADTGRPLAMIDGTHITATRTAAASAVATRTLARDDVSVLTILGAGVQGRSHLDALRRVRDFTEIRVASRTHEHARDLAATVGGQGSTDFESAVRGAGVVCLCTDAEAPVIDRRWLDPGTHVTSVGASPRGGELDHGTVTAGLLVVESRVAFQPPPAGAFELKDVDPSTGVELGEILAGKHPGRTDDEQITVYKSMGHAMEDAVAAKLVYDTVLKEGAGTTNSS